MSQEFIGPNGETSRPGPNPKQGPVVGFGGSPFSPAEGTVKDLLDSCRKRINSLNADLDKINTLIG